MGKVVSYHDESVKCGSCTKFNNACACDNPKAAVGDCLEYKQKVNDPVNHPNHYTQGGIECIKAIEASMSPDGFQDYCKGNVLKYIWRYKEKNGIEDLRKAKVYLDWMIESVEKKGEAE